MFGCLFGDMFTGLLICFGLGVLVFVCCGCCLGFNVSLGVDDWFLVGSWQLWCFVVDGWFKR